MTYADFKLRRLHPNDGRAATHFAVLIVRSNLLR
jgi:hypothetical protein